MTFSITFSDGSKLEGLKLNANNFVSDTEVKDATFAGKLQHVVIDGNAEADEAGLIGEHENMELIQIAHYTQKVHGCPDGWYFVLRDIPAAELEKTKIKGDIAYMSMMTGIELD